mgnify:CR=1 FL=1
MALPCPPSVGLTNLGNTCYANTVYQCLIHTLPLSHYFLSKSHERDTTIRQQHETKNGQMCVPFLTEYHKLLYVLWNQRPPKVTPKSLIMVGMRESMARNKTSPGSTVFMLGKQHDMAEYLEYLLELIHDTTGVPVNMQVHGKVRSRRDQMMVASYKYFEQHFSKAHSIVVDLFAGQYYVQIQTCDNHMPQDHSESFDPFFTLTLSLPVGVKSCTLYDCLSLMREPEIIDGWKGERSPTPRMIEKQTYIWMPPKVLVIHLKRFSNSRVKNNCAVRIEPVLQLTDYCMGTEGPVIYHLYAIGNHEGTLDFGHYYADCKTKTGQWHRFNDAQVQPLNTDRLNPQTCYLLFYHREPTVFAKQNA